VAYAHLADELGADWLKARYLYGIDLTEDSSVAYPDELFEHAIESAIDYMADELDLVLAGMRAVIERRDMPDWSPGSYHLQMLDRRPVRSVTSMALQWGQNPLSELPAEWIHVSSADAGQVQLVPSGSSGVAPVGLPGGLIGTWAMFDGPVPGLHVWNYVAGFESRRTLDVGTFAGNFSIDGAIVVRPSQAPGAATYTVTISGTNRITGAADTEALTWTGTVRERKQTAKSWSDVTSIVAAATAGTPTFDVSGTHPTPPSILDAIGLLASILPLDTAGDLIAGAGIASKSISLDGISQTINTTSSATNSGYGARGLSYQKRLKTLIPSLQARWRPMSMGAI